MWKISRHNEYFSSIFLLQQSFCQYYPVGRRNLPSSTMNSAISQLLVTFRAHGRIETTVSSLKMRFLSPQDHPTKFIIIEKCEAPDHSSTMMLPVGLIHVRAVALSRSSEKFRHMFLTSHSKRNYRSSSHALRSWIASTASWKSTRGQRALSSSHILKEQQKSWSG